MNSCWNHEDLNRSPLERKIPVNSLFCKLFKHSFCFIVRQGSHLRLCGLTHTNSKTTTTRVQGEDISVTLRILSMQKAGGAPRCARRDCQRWVGLPMQVARCQDTTATVKVQTATEVSGYVFSYLPLAYFHSTLGVWLARLL